MKTKGLASLLMSTFLSSVAAYAVGELSDAYNGVIPDDIKKSPTKLKEWQETTTRKFKERADTAGLIYDQAERFFAPMTRRGDEQARVLANAVCGFFEQRAKKKRYIQELFEAHQGVNTKIETAHQFQDGGVPTTGHHIRLTRQIQALTKEIQDIDEKIKAQPDQKRSWEEEIKSNKREIEVFENDLKETERKKANSKLEETKTEREIEYIQHQIASILQSMDKIKGSIQEEEGELKVLKEKIERSRSLPGRE